MARPEKMLLVVTWYLIMSESALPNQTLALLLLPTTTPFVTHEGSARFLGAEINVVCAGWFKKNTSNCVSHESLMK